MNPDTPADIKSLFAKLFDDATIASTLTELGEPASEGNIHATRAELMAQARRLENPEAEAAKLQLFKAKLDTAQIVATLNGVNTAEVFANEDMYRMLLQELYSPDQFAADGLARTRRVVAAFVTERDEADLAVIRRAYNQLTIRELQRYWGQTVFDTLSPKIKAQLGLE